MQDKDLPSSPPTIADTRTDRSLSRRTLLQGAVTLAAAATAGGLLSACSKDPEAPTGASSADPKASGVPAARPSVEQPDVRIGFVAVQSSAPLIVAYEKGFFKKHGLNVTLSKENGWAAARDKLARGVCAGQVGGVDSGGGDCNSYSPDCTRWMRRSSPCEVAARHRRASRNRSRYPCSRVVLL